MKAGKVEQAGCVECLSMHQPWASMLVFGIKRIEGRNWPTKHRGWLWIASTAQEPSAASIEVGVTPSRVFFKDAGTTRRPLFTGRQCSCS